MLLCCARDGGGRLEKGSHLGRPLDEAIRWDDTTRTRWTSSRNRALEGRRLKVWFSRGCRGW